MAENVHESAKTIRRIQGNINMVSLGKAKTNVNPCIQATEVSANLVSKGTFFVNLNSNVNLLCLIIN